MNNQQSDSPSVSNFIPLQKIGQGTYSSVYKVKRVADNQFYALKKIKIASLKEKEKHNALNQIRILASIDSPYIISYKQAFFDESLNILCIVMELASNLIQIQKDEGDLFHKIQISRKKLSYIPQTQIWKAITHISIGLEILHSRSILHRDLKSANIFISNGYYKLGDLNVSKVQGNDSKLAYTQTGTPYYASPQIWNDQPYDSKSDIWSFGCLIYQMCSFKPPFNAKNMEQLYKNVIDGFYDQIPQIYSADLRELIKFCLKKNPKERPSINELLSQKGIIGKKCLGFLKERQTVCQNQQQDILKTIKLPGNLKMLRNKLPKPKYINHNVSSSNIKQIKYSFQQNKQQQQIQTRKVVTNSLDVSHKNKDHSSTKFIRISSQNRQYDQKQQRQLFLKKVKKNIKQDQKDQSSDNYTDLIRIKQQTKQLYDKICSLNLNKKIKTQKSYSQKNYITPLKLQNPLHEQQKTQTHQNKKSLESMIQISRKISEKKRQKYKIGLVRDLNFKRSKIIDSISKKNTTEVKALEQYQEKPMFQKKTSEYCNFDSLNKLNTCIKQSMSKVNSTPYLASIQQNPKLKKISDTLETKKTLLNLKNKINKNVINRISEEQYSYQ